MERPTNLPDTVEMKSDIRQDAITLYCATCAVVFARLYEATPSQVMRESNIHQDRTHRVDAKPPLKFQG